MADINGVVLHAGDITYTITYTRTRPNNSQMTYDFSISALLDPAGFLVVGTALLCTVTVNGASSQVRIKESAFVWNGGETRIRNASVTCNSTTGDTTQAVTFSVVSDGSTSTTSGVITNSAYTVTSLPLLTTACSPPTTCTLDATLAENNVTLSWSGAAGGQNNSITAYEIQYSDSSDNSTWGSWNALTVINTTETFGSLSVSPPDTRGYYRRFRVRTRGSAGASYYSDWTVSSNSVRRNTEPVRPTTVTAAPAEYINEDITVTWSGATGGTSAIKGYMIGRRTSTDNATWSAWSALIVFDLAATSGSRIVTPPYTPGIYVQYGVWTIDIFDVYSNERISNSIHCAITLCGAPTTCMLSAYLAESDVTLSWSGAADGVGNTIESYEVQYSDSADNASWGAWTAFDTVTTTETFGSVMVSPPVTRGYYRKFRVRTRGTIGAAGYSDWTESDGSVRKNRLPAAPTIAAPSDGSSTYNTTPLILITTGVEPDGQNQIVEVKLDSGEWKDSVNNPELFSVSGELGDNKSSIYMGSPLSVGSHIVTVRCTDAGTEAPGPEVARSFTILAPSFEEITTNETKVKATHITTLRNAVNAVRIYYSISAASWSEAIVAGRTYIKNWPFHILELRAAIEPVIVLINVFDDSTAFDIPEPEWLPLGAGRPRANVMNQLRDILNIL